MSDTKQTSVEGPPAPAIRDSDLIYLSIKRLEAIADKMQRFQYDEELDRLMQECIEMFEWAGYNIKRRAGLLDEVKE